MLLIEEVIRSVIKSILVVLARSRGKLTVFNQLNPTTSIKFTLEEEQEGKIPYVDTMIIRKPDNSVKLLVYRKKTHQDQYLSYTSHHPLHHKLGVIRTLLDRSEKEEDKIKEKNHIKQALAKCGYPGWAVNKVKSDKRSKKSSPKCVQKNKSESNRNKGLVVIP